MRRLSLLLALLAASAASAQPSPWSPLPTEGTALALRVQHPTHTPYLIGIGDATADPDDYYRIWTSVWSAEAAVPVGPLRLTAEIPFAVSVLSDAALELSEPVPGGAPDRDRTGAALGNLRIGVETSLHPGVVVGGGLRLPTATDVSDGSSRSQEASLEGFEAMGGDQVATFIADLATLDIHLDARRHVAGPLAVRAFLAPALAFWTDDPLEDRPLLFTAYAVQASIEAGKVEAVAGVGGVSRLAGYRYFTAEEDSEVSLGAVADLELGDFRPGVSVRVPVKGLFSQVLDAVIGLRLSYTVH